MSPFYSFLAALWAFFWGYWAGTMHERYAECPQVSAPADGGPRP